MLSIGKLSDPGSVFGYLTNDTVGDYYREDGRVEGRWIGQGAADLGLDGDVTGEDLGAVLAGIDPTSGTLLGDPGSRSRAGFDLTFSAPKGVSLLAALGGPDIAAEVTAAHRHAVEDALGYLERRATFARRGQGGYELLGTGGLIGAAFDHHTSRALDPQLHTHVIVANVTHAEDDRWSAIDGRALYAHVRTAGILYQAGLRAELTGRLGLEWEPTRRGLAEPAGLDPDMLAGFSRRRADIDAALDRAGRSSPEAAAAATLATRPPKPPAPNLASLRAEWEARAATLGLTPDRLGALTGPGRHAFLDPDQQDRLLSETGLTAHATTFDRRSVLTALAETARDGAPLPLVEDAADRLLSSPEVVWLDRPDRPGGDDTHRYSTVELLGVEADLLTGALNRQDAGAARARPDHLDAALASRPALSDEQVGVVRALTTNGRGVEVLVGPAGTGKTFVLDAARDAWSAGGIPVIGAAVAGRAAAELQAATAIPSGTVWKLLDDFGRPGGGLAPGTCVVIDEAAMVGTRDLAVIATAVEAADGKLVLTGDHHQLPEITAGGTFAALGDRLGPLTLTANRRQDQAWERSALAELRAGSVRAAVIAYDEHDRVVLTPTAPDARAAMVERWATAHTAGDDAVMLASRRADVADLNLRARAELDHRGLLGEAEVIVGKMGVAAGDEVIATRNRSQHGLFNGTRATVTAVDPAEQRLTLRLKDGTELALHTEEAERARLAYGYAMTAHKGQGATVDRAFLLGTDALYREAAYTGMSRARHGTDLIVIEPEPPRRDVAHAPELDPQRDPLEQLIRDASRSHAQLLALEQASTLTPPGTTLAQLRAEQDRLTRRIDGQARQAQPDQPTLDALAVRSQAVRERAAERADLLGRVALAAPAPHLVAELGPPPPDGRDRHEWVTAARAVEVYRDRWEVRDPALALGVRPDEPDRAIWKCHL
jgi:conjugative relaxase-like TrwC/TraI family protein